MSEYCKAYKISKLRQFPGWAGQAENLPESPIHDSGDTEASSQKPGGDDYLFLHDSYVVTDGIFEDKNVVFDKLSPEWKKFCAEKLNFEIPSYQRLQAGDGKV